MTLSDEQKQTMSAYRDRAFITSILTNECSDYNNFLKNIINIPLIIINSALTILNASAFSADELKYMNIVLNGFTVFVLWDYKFL